jgi:bacterioferritin-associated ferredoxin
VSRKVILCRCEDVTLADVEKAIATGFAALEEVKRYTGFGTGPCQGKECLRDIAAVIARATASAPEQMAPFTSRAPLFPTELAVFATPGTAPPTATGNDPSGDDAAEKVR